MTTIAILGGGQLGSYLCQAAVPLDLKSRVLSVSRDEPVWALADACVEGPLDSVQHVLEVAQHADVLTYEIEAIGPACLEALAKEAVIVRPDPGILLTLQNKIKQREFYAAHDFASPLWTSRAEVTTADFDAVAEQLGAPFVQKAATGGYDGRGVQVVRERADLRLDFGASLFEALVPIRTELGMLVARSASSESKVYPPVEMKFHEDNILDVAVCPAREDSEVLARAEALSVQVIEALDGVGLFCIELFVDTEGRVLINELAARVHNSGHLTLEASSTSQFEQHLRAVAGLPLGPVDVPKPAAMVNLLSESVPDAERFGYQPACSDTDTAVHWYMKQDARPLRKMGHITALGDTHEQAITRAKNKARELGFQG
jgi:5-(carboxyamino)imidazole ribonucleotide synthase